MTTHVKTTGTAALLWSGVLGATAIFGSYGFACVFPFAAIATIAALTMNMRAAVSLVALVWAVNQAIGFGFRDYPHTADTVGWGIAIGLAAVAALAAAKAVLRDENRVLSPHAVIALGAAFVAYEGLLFGYALYAGGLETFSAEIVGGIALNDTLWFAGLVVLRIAVTRLVPRWFNTVPSVAA